MWTKFEEKKIGELYSQLPEEKLEDFLPPYLIDAIKMEEGKAYFNLRNFTKILSVNLCVKLRVKYKEIISLFRNWKLIEKPLDLFD